MTYVGFFSRNLTDTIKDKFWDVVPTWEVASKKLRFTMAGFVFFMAICSIILSLFPYGQAAMQVQPQYSHMGQPPSWDWLKYWCFYLVDLMHISHNYLLMLIIWWLCFLDLFHLWKWMHFHEVFCFCQNVLLMLTNMLSKVLS